MTEFLTVFITASSREEGERIASKLVEDKLAACCNILNGITSIYIWEGELCRDEEVLLIVKTVEKKFPELSERVKELHSYDVPEIIALPITYGSKDYLDWVADSLEA